MFGIILFLALFSGLTLMFNKLSDPGKEIRSAKGYLKFKPNEHGETRPYELHIDNPFGGNKFIKDTSCANIRNYELVPISTYFVDSNGDQYFNPTSIAIANILWFLLSASVITFVMLILT